MSEGTNKVENKVVLVTGGSRGIGRAVVEAFLAEGALVAAVSTRRPEWAANRTNLLWKSLDVKDSAAAADAVQEIVSEWGRLDVLVNNAGITRDTLFMRLTDEAWQEVLDVNLSGAFWFAREAGRVMMKARRGSIISISSVVGLRGNGGQVNYAASKAGLIGMTKSLARELGGRGVRVNAVAPGFIETDMTAGLNEKIRKGLREEIPLKKLGQPEDVAALVQFLASDKGAYITGQVLSVDGGLGM